MAHFSCHRLKIEIHFDKKINFCVIKFVTHSIISKPVLGKLNGVGLGYFSLQCHTYQMMPLTLFQILLDTYWATTAQRSKVKEIVRKKLNLMYYQNIKIEIIFLWKHTVVFDVGSSKFGTSCRNRWHNRAYKLEYFCSSIAFSKI